MPLYKFKISGYIYYKFCQSRRIKDYVIHNASLKNINLEQNSIISDVILTKFSKYKSIKRNHLLNQPRSNLISKILKQLHSRDFGDKLTKYFYLSKKYGIIYIMIIHVIETRYNKYIDCLLNKDNKNLYMKYINNNVDVNEFDKIFNNYIISHNKKFDLYYINCEFEIETNNDLINIEINFHYNTDYFNLNS